MVSGTHRPVNKRILFPYAVQFEAPPVDTLPGGHMLVCAAPPMQKSPAGHALQVALFGSWYVPFSQSVQLLAPPAETLPTAHGVHVAAPDRE